METKKIPETTLKRYNELIKKLDDIQVTNTVSDKDVELASSLVNEFEKDTKNQLENLKNSSDVTLVDVDIVLLDNAIQEYTYSLMSIRRALYQVKQIALTAERKNLYDTLEEAKEFASEHKKLEAIVKQKIKITEFLMSLSC